MNENENTSWEMPGFPEHRVSGTTDEGRVRYLRDFVPPDHLAGMEMFVRHYGGWQLGPRARTVLLLALLEGWAAALMYLEDITPIIEEVTNGETVNKEADGEGDTEQLGGSTQPSVEGGEEGAVAGVEDSGPREHD